VHPLPFSTRNGGPSPPPSAPGPNGTVWRVLLVVLGFAVFAVGTLIWLSPAPGGFLLLALGTSLVLTHSKIAKRRFLTLKRRYPQLLVPLRALLKRFTRNRSPR
jgi:hypothetical protein